MLLRERQATCLTELCGHRHTKASPGCMMQESRSKIGRLRSFTSPPRRYGIQTRIPQDSIAKKRETIDSLLSPDGVHQKISRIRASERPFAAGEGSESWLDEASTPMQGPDIAAITSSTPNSNIPIQMGQAVSLEALIHLFSDINVYFGNALQLMKVCLPPLMSSDESLWHLVALLTWVAGCSYFALQPKLLTYAPLHLNAHILNAGTISLWWSLHAICAFFSLIQFECCC